jgi:hypothetical protein
MSRRIDVGVIVDEDGAWSVGPAGIECCFEAHRMGGQSGTLLSADGRLACAQALEPVIQQLLDVMRRLLSGENPQGGQCS